MNKPDIFSWLLSYVGIGRTEPLVAAAAAAASTAEVRDVAGQEVDVRDLDKEIAAPTLGGVRSILNSNVTTGLDPMKLARVLNAAVEGQPDDYYRLCEEMEERFPQYQATMKARKLAVTQLEMTIEAAGDDPRSQKDAELCRQYIARGDLELEAYDILDSFGKGFSVTELMWPEGKARNTFPWLPSLKTRDQCFFEFDQVDGETLRLKGGPDNNSVVATDLPPYKFIIHRTAAKTGLTVRGGLGRGVAWSYLFHNMTLRDWVILAEVYGMPIRIGKYDQNSTPEDRRKLLNAVTQIATDAAAIIPDTMMLEFIKDTAGATPAMYRELCEYLDQAVSKLVLGQTATTDATSGGLGGSQGNVHNDVREDFQRADARALAAALTRDLFRPLVDVNHGPPPNGLYPRCRIGRADEFTKEQAAMIYDYVDRGGRVEMSVIGDKLGLPDAPEGDDVKLLKSLKSGPQNSGAGSGEVLPPLPGQGPGQVPASQRFSVPVKRKLLIEMIQAAAASGQPADAVDDLIEQAADQWEAVLAPMLDPIDELAAAAADFDAFTEGLTALQTEMGAEKVTELLARSLFATRVAAEVGVDMSGAGQ